MSPRGAKRPNRKPKKVAATRSEKSRSGGSRAAGSIGAGGMKFGLRIPSYALGPRTASLAEMG
ncbi:MAG TPA: hypothetical protein VNQ72_10490, partial [Candidatus Dormibacteraeota bacterium]|nr:hypothetical protein [Candidatus Dormibacteraeota bacterium]